MANTKWNLFKWFNKPKSEEDSEILNEEALKNEFEDDYDREIGEYFEESEDYKDLLRQIDRYVYFDADVMVQSWAKKLNVLGYKHGVRGISDVQALKLAKLHIEIIRKKILVACKSKVAKLEVEKNSLNEELDITKDEYEKNEDNFKELQLYKSRKGSAFSKLLKIFLFIVAGVMIIADFFVLEDVVKDAFAIDSSSYMSIFLAAGVVAISVYIKEFYNDYFMVKENHWITFFKGIPNVEDDEEKKAYRLRKKRLVVNSIILFLAFCTILFLGKLRHQVEFAVNKKYYLGNLRLDPIWHEYSLIGLTIILPIIGGIILAKAMHIGHNIKAFKSLNSKKDKLTKKRLTLNEELKMIDENIARIQEYICDWGKTTKGIAEDLTDYLVEYYKIGYISGTKVPESHFNGKDLYALVQTHRIKRTASVVWKFNN